MDAINIENLIKTYRPVGGKVKTPVNALAGLDLKVKKGEIFGFIGPNGAGKTTAIKILVGLIRANSGSAYIFDEPAGSIKARQQLGYLSEISYYYPFMEAGDMLDYFARLSGMSSAKRKERVDEVLAEVGLKDWKQHRISGFSKGMQQRFGIAQALISDPPLLILDEPTSGLDPIGQKEVKDIILKLKNRGYTIFFSSHKLTEVEHICDTIGIINHGKMLKVDKLENLLGVSRQEIEATRKSTLEEIFFDLITKA